MPRTIIQEIPSFDCGGATNLIVIYREQDDPRTFLSVIPPTDYLAGDYLLTQLTGTPIPSDVVHAVWREGITEVQVPPPFGCYLKRLKNSHQYGGRRLFRDFTSTELAVLERLHDFPHDNVCGYYGCLREGLFVGHLCLKGYQCNLEEMMTNTVPPSRIKPPFDSRTIILDVQAGVVHLHKLGLVHNDITPRHVMLDENGHAVIIDFDTCAVPGVACYPGTPEGESVADNLVGRSAAFDRAVFKDKLGSIVRSKEGHMVNVSSPLPFNLHNKPRAFIDIMTRGSHFSSSSRSASTSTFRESQSPNQPHLNSRPPALVHMRSGLRAPPLNSAGQSRSRSASQSSMTSATSSQRDEERGEKEPSGILGVRLVRGFGPGSRFSSQRGRAKGKQIEEAGMGPANISGHIEPVNDPQDPHAECVDLPQNAPNDGYPEVSISPASDTLEFRLHEVGTLSASWEIER
ncbi:hypothetical protein C0989_012209 [Termitomyces sp. Mn162]|nr:hypothetical protein C0989_012209 [Termitomyces sp. Mn162]